MQEEQLAGVWAAVVAANATESLELREAIGSTAVYTVTTYYRADVTPKMRLSWTPYKGSAKTLEIRGVQPTPDRAFLTMTCSEGAI